MRLAIVIGSLDRGGAERHIVELVRSLHPHRAECLVICLREEGQLAGAVREAGAAVFSVGFVGSRSVRSVFSVGRLIRLLRATRPDAVYAINFWSYVLALLLARLAAPRAARIAGRQSMPEFDVPTKRFLLPLRNVADWLSDAVIVNSEALRNAWLADSPRLATKLQVVPNGVRAISTRKSVRGQDGSLVIVCVANLNPHKGHRTLLEALSRLPAELEWTLLLAGEGPERGAISQQARELGLDHRVRLLGLVEDIDGLLEQADIAVLASDTEGSPNAVLEAMAHALPVVATGVGGVRELLGSGAGLLVPPRDPQALAEELTRMLADPDLRERAGEAGRREAEEHYSVSQLRDETLTIINAAVQGASGH
jgi:glycosyltransferase involved in cell wall biosynthesis